MLPPAQVGKWVCVWVIQVRSFHMWVSSMLKEQGPAMNVGFPPLCLQDGPLGIRFADNITAFSAGITVGATWNRELMFVCAYQYIILC